MMEYLYKNTDWPYELILIDNGSTDGSADDITNFKFDINGQLIINKENRGFGPANNQGAKLAYGIYLCFLNNDTIPTKGWLGEMVKLIESDPKIGVVGNKLLHPGRGTIQHAGVYEHESGTPDHLYFGKPYDYPDANKVKEYFAVTGACFLTPKRLFLEMRGFDEGYRNGYEDIDYCNRVKQKGYKIMYTPESVVYHYESRTEGRYDNESANWNRYMGRWVLR
jgi:GT2 family glycosyltransferase